jgi:hypothetical protein
MSKTTRKNIGEIYKQGYLFLKGVKPSMKQDAKWVIVTNQGVYCYKYSDIEGKKFMVSILYDEKNFIIKDETDHKNKVYSFSIKTDNKHLIFSAPNYQYKDVWQKSISLMKTPTNIIKEKNKNIKATLTFSGKNNFVRI